MSGAPPERIAASAELGQGDRRLDLLLGRLALLPPPMLALAAWATPPGALRAAAMAAGVAWGGALLAFWAGVRRGLTFSETSGARPAEVAAFLGVFAVGVAGAALVQPPLLAAGIVLAGALDARAARGEAPRYFSTLRPAQAAVGALSLLALGMRLLT